RDGWQVVADYSDPEREVGGARSGLGLADVSAFAKVSLRGPGVASLVQSLVPDGVALSLHGVALLSAGAALACRLATDYLLLLAFSPKREAVGPRLADLHTGLPLVQTDVTSAYAGFEVMGPGLEEFLRRLTPLDVRPASFPVNSCAETALAGV